MFKSPWLACVILSCSVTAAALLSAQGGLVANAGPDQSGMTIGTLFTLFVLPAFYLYLARDHAHDRDSKSAPQQDDGDALPPEPATGH